MTIDRNVVIEVDRENFFLIKTAVEKYLRMWTGGDAEEQLRLQYLQKEMLRTALEIQFEDD